MCCWFVVELVIRKVWDMAEEMSVAEIGNVDLPVCICPE